MSDRRLQSSRDDHRRRDRDGDRRDRRRSRSPHRRRNEQEVDSYQSSRGYREREREERYGRGDGRGGGRDDREWGRDRGSARRDARRDDDDRRRDRRGDRDDLFADRRPRRDDRRDDRDRDRGRDRDDMRQLERQAARKSASPARKPKEPTPDLTDVVSVLEMKRRMTQWDIKPPGYENVTAEQAKLSGMFPLPGAPRQQPMDPTRLQAFMNQPGNQANGAALKPASARQSKRLMVFNIPSSADENKIVDFFNLHLNGLNVTRGVDPCISAQTSIDNKFALVEFKTPEDATNALAFDGIKMDPTAPATDGNPDVKGLDIRRPRDYIVPAVTDETENEAGVLSSIVPDTQNKLSVSNLPIYLGEDQIMELLQSFGELKNFVLVKDKSTEESRGIAFCEYKLAENTRPAIDSLNGMELGDAAMKVKLASIGIKQVSSEMSVNAMSMLAGTAKEDMSDSGRVLCLMNMITPEELMDAEEADGKLTLLTNIYSSD